MAKDKAKIQSKVASDGTYDWIHATVTEQGISMTYQVTGLERQGSDFLDDEGAQDWDDDDVLKQIALMLSLDTSPKNLKLIQLER